MNSPHPAPSPLAPKLAAKAKGTYKGQTGRKVLEKAAIGTPSGNAKDEDANNEPLSPRSKGKQPGSRNVDDLERLLEEDTMALDNMRREINEAQKNEIEKFRHALAELKREHDTIRTSNDVKEKSLIEKTARIRSLTGVRDASESTGVTAQKVRDNLKKAFTDVMDNLAAENRSIDMQTLMTYRLDEEIHKVKSEQADVLYGIEQTKHELTNGESSLRLSKHELLEQEKLMESLTSTMKMRREKRTGKLQLLQSIVLEESTMAKSQIEEGSLMSTTISPRKSRLGARYLMKLGITPRDGRSPGSKKKAGQRLVASDSVTILDPDDPEGKKLSGSQVREMIERFQTRESRLQKLQQAQNELHDNLSVQHDRTSALLEELERVAEKRDIITSTRQFYQELEVKDVSVANARRQCDEWHEMDSRLKSGIESLRRAIPRFLAKITKGNHSIPTEEQLPTYLHKVEEETSRLIKSIDTALLMDATPEDLLTISQNQQSQGTTTASENTSEVGRLQKLPGYSRMLRRQFFNLMSARPDISDQNLRVLASEMRHRIDVYGMKVVTKGGAVAAGSSIGSKNRKLHIQGDGLEDEAVQSVDGSEKSDAEDDVDPENFLKLNIVEEAAVDREAVKNISRLVLETTHKRSKV